MRQSKIHISRFVFALLLLTSCETEFQQSGAGIERETLTYAIYITTNTGDSSGFLVPFDALPSGDIDVTQNLDKGIQLADTRNAGVGFDGAVYHTSNPAGIRGIQRLLLDVNGNFVEDGFIPTGTASYGGGTTFGFATSTKGYYSDHSLRPNALEIFNPKTMETIGEVDCSQAIAAIRENVENKENIVTVGMGGFMIERDGKFFTELYFSDENNFQVDDKTYVVVIDVATDTLERIIIWDDHLKIGYFSFKNVNYVNIDELGDMYLSSFIGNFTDPEGPNFRTIRIKKGETDFDRTWDLDGNRGDFPGGENFALGGAVLNGKMYLKMFSTTMSPSFAEAGLLDYYAYEVDLETRNATQIEDIPVGYWRSIHGPALYGGKPYFVVENDDVGKAYYYSYDPVTQTSQLEITITGGQPQNIVAF
ncbi:MAG: hypothetical protein AAGA86_06510 [Bacteroidota bacterium]